MNAIQLRELVLATLDELGLGQAHWLGERLLFRDRYYAGMCFDFEGVSAIWMADASEVRFIDEAGKLLKTVAVVGAHGIAGQAA